jgi:hypothetical protein
MSIMLLLPKRMRGARSGAVLLALMLAASMVHAQPVPIPNSEMPGRERDRFIDLPVPKSQAPELQRPTWKRPRPAPHQRRATAKPGHQ